MSPLLRAAAPWLIASLLFACTDSSLPPVERADRIVWIGARDPNFDENLQTAVTASKKFAAEHGWKPLVNAALITEVRHFENKALFDEEIIKLADGQIKTLPATYVAVMDHGIIRVVSWAAYRGVHPTDSKDDYIKILRHEIAHELHSKLVGDDHMGPRWFYEGFAVVAADQYTESPVLSDQEIADTIRSTGPADYKMYGYTLRKLMQTHDLNALVEGAKLPEAEFVKWLGY